MCSPWTNRSVLPPLKLSVEVRVFLNTRLKGKFISHKVIRSHFAFMNIFFAPHVNSNIGNHANNFQWNIKSISCVASCDRQTTDRPLLRTIIRQKLYFMLAKSWLSLRIRKIGEVNWMNYSVLMGQSCGEYPPTRSIEMSMYQISYINIVYWGCESEKEKRACSLNRDLWPYTGSKNCEDLC